MGTDLLAPDLSLKTISDVRTLLQAIEGNAIRNDKYGLHIPPNRWENLAALCSARESDCDVMQGVRENCASELAFLEASLLIDECKSLVVYLKTAADYDLASSLNLPCEPRWSSNENMLDSVFKKYNEVLNIHIMKVLRFVQTKLII